MQEAPRQSVVPTAWFAVALVQQWILWTVLPGPTIALGQTCQRGGKIVHAWAVCGDADPDLLSSNTFEMEWPRGSGQMRSFPEVDKAAWFDLDEARRRILPAQAVFLDALVSELPASP